MKTFLITIRTYGVYDEDFDTYIVKAENMRSALDKVLTKFNIYIFHNEEWTARGYLISAYGEEIVDDVLSTRTTAKELLIAYTTKSNGWANTVFSI